MSDVTFVEKQYFERLLGMSDGYVLDFSNRTFDEFVTDCIGRNIYDPKYELNGSSKANRLRAFWSVETNYLVGKLMRDMVRYAASLPPNGDESALIAQCEQIADRLLQSAPVPDIDAIMPNAPGRTFEALAKSIRESIDNNEPEAGLDRLHTFVIKYVRSLCDKHGLAVEKDKPLHSLFGEYVKYLKGSGKLSSRMSETIMKSAISPLDAFNYVRNNQSLAHDNEVLNYAESLLIFNHVTAVIRFIEWLETPPPAPAPTKSTVDLFSALDEIPF